MRSAVVFVIEIPRKLVVALPVGGVQLVALRRIQLCPEHRRQRWVKTDKRYAHARNVFPLDQSGSLQLPAKAGPQVGRSRRGFVQFLAQGGYHFQKFRPVWPRLVYGLKKFPPPCRLREEPVSFPAAL